MKKSIFNSALILMIAITTVAFTTLTEKTIKIQQSSIKWKGYKVTGEHEGTIQLKDGNFTFNEGQITGGKFTIDMSSINVTDLEGEMKGNLEGHLKSNDFFGVEKHPTATFEITKIQGKSPNIKVTGNMTIKNLTREISFPMTVNEDSAVANLKIDRSKYDVRYGSKSFFDNLQDKMIYDEFDLNIEFRF